MILARHRTATVLIAAAVVSSAAVWWLVAWPVLVQAPGPVQRHAEHGARLYLHAVAGTLMLFAGAAALYVGWTRQGFRGHRVLGYAYLAGGLVSATAALWLAFSDPHESPALSAATGALAAAWLVCASMAYRAIRNRRFESHRDWMTRSYVLTWSFVFCRGLEHSPAAPLIAPLGASAVWLTWIVPLLICEVALQWRNGGKGAPARTATQSRPAG